MKISRNWLQTYFREQIPSAEKLMDLFAMHSSEIEGIEHIVSTEKTNDGKIFDIEDDILDIKVLPDRAHYALSHRGIAGELASIMRMKKVSRKDNSIKDCPISIKEAPKVDLQVPNFCRRYMARYVEIPALEPSLESRSCSWLRSRLQAIGQRSINAIVDATNYVMYDIGQPLHAFDADKVKGNLVVRAAREGEKIVLLDGRELTLTSADHVIADDEGALVVAGAKGGKRAEISQSTRRMIIESANFDPTAVRRTSTKYDIRSDSSKRFENEITPELASDGMAHISALIQELMPEARFSAITDQYPVKAVQTVIMFDPDYIKERLGIEVPLQEAKDILNSMDMVIEEAGKKWKLTVPFMRLDLVLPEDIVEEVGRIYGYDHIQGILPPALKDKAAILSAFYLSEKIKNVLVEHDFSEVDLYTLVAKGQIEVFHPLAKDKAFIRENLIDGMTACVEKNVMNADLLGLDIIRVFEIGHVFSKEKESSMLAIGVGLAKKIKGHKAEDDIKKAIEALNESLGISLSSPKIVSKGNMAVCEIDLDEAFKNYKPLSDGSYADLHFHKASDNVYKKISPYPFMVRDIAVFVPENIQAEAVWQSISQGIKEAEAEALLVRHALFDTFKKDGKVSYAFRMVFQSMDKTMTDDQANGIMEKIYAEMKGNSWEVR